MQIYNSQTTATTQQLAKRFASQVQHGGIILLYGNLGAGKTTFVQGLAEGLGISKRIISPTFVIVRRYEFISRHPEFNSGSQKDWIPDQIWNDEGFFYHIDLYRLQGEKHELEEIGLFDVLKNQHNIVAIEWPEKMNEFLPKKRWEVLLEQVNEGERRISIKKV